jgi:uncharacterized protein
MTAHLPVSDSRDGARFLVRVSPRASRTAVAGVIGDENATALKIALHAPPVEGRANAALIEFLATLLAVPRSAIEISAGQHARNKTILVRNRTAGEIAAALHQALEKPKGRKP